MKKSVLVICLSLLILNLCGCSIFQNSGNQDPQTAVETSIVYVYMTDDSEETTSNTTTVEENRVNETEITAVVETKNDDEIVNDAIIAAEEMISKGEFDKAQNIIVEAKHKVGNSPALRDEQERINNFRPVRLKDLNMLSGKPTVSGKQEISTGEIVDCLGVTINDIDSHETKTTGFTYPTYGRYETFTCTLALLNDLSKNSPLECYLEVYLDGILSYTSPSIKAGKMPEQITVDISGAESVEIRFCCTNNLDDDWLASMWSLDRFYAISYVIAEPVFIPEYIPLQ